MSDEDEKGMLEGAAPTAPGGMPQKALVDELMQKHGWTEDDARALTWPDKIEAVITERRAAEIAAAAEVETEPDPEQKPERHLTAVPEPGPAPHIFERSSEGSGRICMADGCGEVPDAEVHVRNADGWVVDADGSEIDENDPEEFCSDCCAGLESSEHFEKCTRPKQEKAEAARYGHDREGSDCASEICGSPSYDPCTYSPEEIASFEAEAAAEAEAYDAVPGVAESVAESVAEVTLPVTPTLEGRCSITDLYRMACGHCQGTVAPEVENVVSGAPLPPEVPAAALGIVPAAVPPPGVSQKVFDAAAAYSAEQRAEAVETVTEAPQGGSVGDPSPAQPVAEGRKMKFSNSELRKFKRCRRAWWLSYYRGLTLRREGVGPLSLGNMVHKPLELYYAEPVRDPSAFDWQTPLAQYVEARLADPALPDHLHSQMLDDYELVKIMLSGYFDWLAEEGPDSEINVIAAEREIEAYIGLIEGTEVFLIGKLDTEVELKSDGRRAFMDHKSAANLTDLPKMGQKDEQFLTYGLLQRLKATAEGRTDERFAHGGVWNMLRKVKRTATAKPPFYGRSGVQHNDEAYRTFFARVWGEVSDILRVRRELDEGVSHHVVAYPNPTRDCAWDCPFVGICPQFDDGSDVESVIDVEYIQHDPYARYEEIEKG